MHYVTFVAVDVGNYPNCKIADEKIKAYSIPNKVIKKCRRGELRSHTNSFEWAVNSAVWHKLEPYCECTNIDKYLEFIDETEDIRNQYETGIDCIKLPGGKIKTVYTLWDKFCIKDGLVYQINFGQLKQDKRSKRAKKMIALPNYPFKKLYKTFEDFAEKYRGLRFYEDLNAYGYYCNPNSFWDWYRIGGGWPCNFLVQEECQEYTQGDYDGELPEPPTGYKWASAARKKDIQWQALIEYEKKYMLERFELYRSAFKKKELPQDEWSLNIKGDGIYHYSNVAVYLDGESFEENQLRRGFVVDSDYLNLPCYYVDDEYWYSECSSKESGTWEEEIKHFYDGLSNDTVLVSVDCHN